MKVRNKILIAIVFLILLFVLGGKILRAYSRAAAKSSLGQCLKDIQYVPGGTDPFQTMDIYLPKKPRAVPVPLIGWIHGGAWVSGDKNHPPYQVMIERGYAVASLNYRLTNRDAHPAQIFDCKAAIRFLRAHANDYGIDPDRIGVWGHSAGGHLAALIGTSGDVKELEGQLGNNEFSSRVECAADWSGPSDLSTIAAQAPKNCKIDFMSPSNPVAVLMGANQTPAAYLQASPVKWVSADDPPLLIWHAEDDDIVPVAQSKELCDLLKKNSVKVDCHITRYGGHGLFRHEFINDTMDFFDKHLGKK